MPELQIQPQSRTAIHLLSVFATGLVLFLFLAGVSAKAFVPADFLYGTQTKTGTEPYDLPYRYLLPANYDKANAYPVILFLHGSYEVGTNNEMQLTTNGIGAFDMIAANRTSYPCFLLVPQANNTTDGWNANNLGQVVRAIRDLATKYSIDLNRVYVTGPSMGGYGTWSIIRLYPFVFAAAVPVSGGGASGFERMAAVPIWCFHTTVLLTFQEATTL